MAGLFGTDFDANRPTDASQIKFGASWIRDIKARIKTTFGIAFNLETGNFKSNVVPSSALKALNPNPAGSYTEVTVNDKGQVTGGSGAGGAGGIQVVQLWQAVYGSTNGFYFNHPASNTLTTVAAPTPTSTHYEYTFKIPDNVTVMRVRMWGAGGGGQNTYPGGAGAYAEVTIPVTAGTTYNVKVPLGGTAGGAGVGADGNDAIFGDVSDDVYVLVPGGSGGGTGAPGVGAQRGAVVSPNGLIANIWEGSDGNTTVSGGTPPYTSEDNPTAPAFGGAVATAGEPGKIILEYVR